VKTSNLSLLLALSPFLAACVSSADAPFDDGGSSSAADADLGGIVAQIDASYVISADAGGNPVVEPWSPDGSPWSPQPPGDSADAGDSSVPVDAPPPPPFDAGDAGVCTTPLAPGDLVIDELMIASVAGTGDHGEWLEVRSTRACALDILGLHGECPTGAKVVTLDVLDDTWIPPYGTFLVADSVDPAVEHDLPGAIVTWTGEPGDVLRNKGTTITLSSNGSIIVTLTYPALKLTYGATWALPADCDDAKAGDFAAWQLSASSWFPGFYGTPNAPNADIHCSQ
jgi:hypothetical protein